MKKCGIERKFLWHAVLAVVGIVVIHLIAVLVRDRMPGLSYPVWPVTIGTAGVMGIVAWFTAGILPARLDGSARRHPIQAALVATITLLMVVQTARIAANRVDPDLSMAILSRNPQVIRHECGPAYFHAAELSDRGEENIYLAEHYPALYRDAEPRSDIEGMKVDDAYMYPPQFLLLPKLLLSLSNNYPTLRYIWFSLQFLGIGAAVLLLARWVGGSTGMRMTLLAPWLIASPAALYAYQFTQFHFAVVALAVAGMLAFEHQRNALGGALLAFAIIGKIFPVLLLVPLLAEKRWKALAWTFGFGMAYTLAALAVLGVEPFIAFIDYQLPRMHSFAAFGAMDATPEISFGLIVSNLSPYAQILRLGEMGVPGMTMGLASTINPGFTLLLAALTWLAARRTGSRFRRAQLWLAILGLASMASPGAWSEYTCLPALWLLSILVACENMNRRGAIALFICGVFFYFLPGVIPNRLTSIQQVAYALSSTLFALLVGLQFWVLLRRPPPTPSPAEFAD